MLSDEEKEALEILNNTEWDGFMITIKNLIEKQSKEIEELKAISEYREKIIKGLELKTLPKTITGFRELIENNDKKWVDKIKVKIEEVQNLKAKAKDIVFKSSLNYIETELKSLLKKE